MDPLVLALAVCAIALLLIILVLLARRAHDMGDVEDAWRGVSEHMAETRLELRTLSERVLQLERSQNQVHVGLTGLDRTLAQADVVSRSLVETTGVMRQELAAAKSDLAAIQAQAKARQDLEAQTATSIRRLEAILAGTQSKGAAGENVLESVFARLPPEWQVRNFKVNGKVVEFGLRLPNNRVLPIDSKWPATDLLEQFAACEDPAQQQQIKKQVERAVLAKANEVRKYVDPNLTVDFGLAAVPDAVYDLCGGIQADLFQMNVALIGHSMFIPYLLLVFHTTLKSMSEVDVAPLLAYVSSAQESVAALQKELDGRFSQALTMLTNSRGDMSVQLSRLSAGLSGLQASAPAYLPPDAADL